VLSFASAKAEGDNDKKKQSDWHAHDDLRVKYNPVKASVDFLAGMSNLF